MNLHENSDFGRKVFFLNVSEDFKTTLAPLLLENEFEIYFISNYKRAKNALRLYPDSICFVCIDFSMPPENWFNFIISFEDDPLLSTIFLGILSEKNEREVREYFLLNATIPAGFIVMQQDPDELVEKISKILEINGAKGRRKFVRANCADDMLISMQCKIENELYSLSIQNLSSIGASCKISNEHAPKFQLNMLIREATLYLRGKMYKCSVIVILLDPSEKDTTVVLLFTKGVTLIAKNAIHEYLQNYLQKKINAIIDLEPQDNQNYSIKPKNINPSDDNSFLIPLDNISG